MRKHRAWVRMVVMVALTATVSPATQGQAPGRPPAGTSAPPKLAAYKQEAAAGVDAMYGLAQQMVDSCSASARSGSRKSRRSGI
jgi:hypothetical protein